MKRRKKREERTQEVSLDELIAAQKANVAEAYQHLAEEIAHLLSDEQEHSVDTLWQAAEATKARAMELCEMRLRRFARRG